MSELFRDNQPRIAVLQATDSRVVVEQGDHVVLSRRLSSEAAECLVEVGEGAVVEIDEVATEVAAGALVIRQQAGSRVRLTAVYLGNGGKVHHRVELSGAEAELDYSALYVVGAEENMTLTLDVRHKVADCRSSEVVKGIAGGRATGRFSGLIYVAPDAQHTDAQQQSRNLLLTEEARIMTEPQLEIYADDVKCSHGATVGMMDEDAIWYMRQRGIDESAARRLQMTGFAADVVSQIGDAKLCEELGVALEQRMEELF